MSQTIDEMSRESDDLSETIRLLFIGKNPAVIGATLVELTAMWMAGHRIPHNERAELFAKHEAFMWEMVATFDAVLEKWRPQ